MRNEEAISSFQHHNDLMEYIQLAERIPSLFGRLIERIIRRIWKDKAETQGYDKELIQAYGERLSEGIEKGYGKDLIEAGFDTQDHKLIHSLQKNVWQFSGAKTYSQLKELSEALYRPDGTLRSFEEFRVQSTIITGKHLRHLKTEYNTAVAGAMMAAKWKTIQEQKETYPLLQFLAVVDPHTTETCHSLHKVIRPVDDIFWQRYYPPNHYNCRSTVKQLEEGEITPEDEIVYPELPEMFKVNLGERGLAFPEDHAYFVDTPEEVLKAGRQFHPYDMQFDIIDLPGKNKGIIREHYMIDKESTDYLRIFNLAAEKAKGEKTLIDLMPTLDPNSYAAQRLIVFPDAKKGKSPDMRINNVLWEEEGVHTPSRRAIKGAIEEGSRQANNVYISIENGLVIDFELKNIVDIKFKDHSNLQTIIIRHKGVEYKYKRS